MGVVGKNPNQRRRVRVRTSSLSKNAPLTSRLASATPTAAYIAEMCGELVGMAKGANLTFLSHLLAMAQAEAEYASELAE